ncbi:hypothetical protein SLEP1_g5507 [Rubroshorea leprosula]|uniref:Uncharacterized protein n=1 Tax=Rubroshorea leprosula TaxID=152421 RepID=A0AAV5HY35_9ROSI|nr:hypothetical protein SLEP1_g5507 [Rubroshorea leprosula]
MHCTSDSVELVPQLPDITRPYLWIVALTKFCDRLLTYIHMKEGIIKFVSL